MFGRLLKSKFIKESFLLKKFFSYDFNKAFFFVIHNFTPIIKILDIKFFSLFPIPMKRGLTLLTKEPDMIEFINDNVNKKHVYYDVGANIGVFSLFVAKKIGAKCISFEPESSNYFFLNKNISINNLSSHITAFNIALHDKNETSFLFLKEDIFPGKSGNSFGDAINEDKERFSPKFQQGCLAMKLDDFVFLYKNPFPNHIKVDVDGNEDKVLNGMQKILKDRRLLTISVEVNKRNDLANDIHQLISESGFVRSLKYVNEKYEETGVVNYFFIRKD